MRIRPGLAALLLSGAALAEGEGDGHGLVYYGRQGAKASSLTSDRKPEVREVHVHDLVTVRIKDGYSFVNSAKLTTDNKDDTKFTINKMFNITGGEGGHDLVARPTATDKPSIDLTSERKHDSKGDTSARQSLDVILTGHVVEVFPNSTFSFEAVRVTEQDENKMTITVFGIARAQDLSPDNLLSGERLDSKQISVVNEGPVARTAKRGWLVKILDFLWPF